MENRITGNKLFYVYFSDYPGDPLKVKANTKTEARQIGREYNRAWRLKASIVRIDEVIELV